MPVEILNIMQQPLSYKYFSIHHFIRRYIMWFTEMASLNKAQPTETELYAILLYYMINANHALIG